MHRILVVIMHRGNECSSHKSLSLGGKIKRRRNINERERERARGKGKERRGGKAVAWSIKNVVPVESHKNEIARYNDERFQEYRNEASEARDSIF